VTLPRRTRPPAAITSPPMSVITNLRSPRV
jgi:hypothetical protein